MRTDVASRVIRASPAEIFPALIDPTALVSWLPPQGMTGRFDEFDGRPGGSYRLVLTYEEPADNAKTSPDSDVVEARFVEILPDVRVVHAVTFVSDHPDYAGTMMMYWELAPTGDGTRVQFRAGNVPPGISAEDHARGLASSLANLAKYVERRSDAE
jgi:uncharacterized protein YndB with AHSA1/START domain